MARATVAHGTVPLTVTVHYQFHPFAGTSVPALTMQKESVTVRGPDGLDLKIPKWMLSPAYSGDADQ